MLRRRKLFAAAFSLYLLTPLFLLQVKAGSQSAAAAVPYFSDPTLAPSRTEIAFVSGGDIWTVPAAGGEARLLVSHPATESRPLYSPDGLQLAFVSSRTGNGDVYLLTLASGELKRLTFDDGFDHLDSWSRDGRWIYFSSTSRDISGMNDIFRVASDGGTPMPVSADRYANEYWAAPSPDGRSLAFTARGITSSQWWRKGRSHLDESEIWLMRDGEPPAYEKLAGGGAKEMWPMWAADGRGIFYVSDRSGAQNIWSRPAQPSESQARQVTSFKDGRVLWPSISYDGREIVFERNFAIWRLDTTSGKAAEISITRRGAAASPATEHLALNNQFQEFELSPDGKKVAFVVRGEVFAASAKDGGDAARVTTSAAAESQVAWSPDSRRLAYVSDRDGTPHLFIYDFATGAETQITREAAADISPQFSPDGKMLAFERDARELRVINLDSRQERALASGYFNRPPITTARSFAWSPDSRWIAYMSTGDRSFRNAYVVPAAGGEARPISFLANVFSNTISWSADGTFILFDTGQRTEAFQLARVDLIARTPKFREDQFRDLFREEPPRTLTPAEPRGPRPQNQPQREAAAPDAPPAQAGERRPAPRQVEINFEGIRQRLSMLPVGVNVNYQTVSPDGKWVLMIAEAAGQLNLYVYSLDELSREPAVARQLTSTPGFKSGAQFSPDSKEVFYIEQGRINVVPLDTRQPRSLAVTAEMDVDFAREKIEVFRQAWTYLRDHFYDPNYHGVDWQAARDRYEPFIRGAQTPDEMRRLISLMVGELNASHLGIGAPGGSQFTTGRIGLRFDRREYEASGRLRVTEVIPLSPAALAREVRPGDYLLAVDGRPLDPRANLDELLSFKINRRVVLTVAQSADGAVRREIALRPVNSPTEKGLIYRAWVNEKRDYVARVSGGRLGYVHMFDMSSNSLAQLYVDLDAENHSREGVIVDVRNNNGGFVNVYAIDVLARRGYLTMTPRGFPAAPARTMLGQRALELPTILVTNQHSLSDAEDFTEGYRALRLGKVVGEPTSGWIIYTWNVSLIDGSSLRLPRMKVTASDGTNMELKPRPVDVAVARPVGESYTGRDSQLDRAASELLKQLSSRESGSTR
jgi:Tol biopolymer transport system component/C-terminal processing protease CtpA/Prc